MLKFDSFFGLSLHQLFENLLIVTLAIALGIALKYVLKRTFLWFSRFWANFFLHSVIRHLEKPIAFFIPLLLLNAALPLMEMSAMTRQHCSRALEIALTINFCILLIKIISVLEDYFFHNYDLTKEDNLKERKLRTQLQFVRKFTVSLIVIITAAIILLSFESMRKIGTGLLTGVGIGGIIIGFAAQKSLGNLLAGFQIAFTQPNVVLFSPSPILLKSLFKTGHAYLQNF
jgi:small-conductance mechanosensitive channel